jgi:hypothetical protein
MVSWWRALATAALSGDRIKNLKPCLEDLMGLFRPGRVDDVDGPRCTFLVYSSITTEIYSERNLQSSQSYKRELRDPCPMYHNPTVK